MTQDILPPLVGRLLQKNKIAFDKTELSFQIQSHPSYPSLHAITGVLDHFKIENVAARIPTDQASLEQLPDTFMAQVENDLVVVTRSKKGFLVFGSTHRTETWSVTEFLEKFGGVVVAVESSGEPSGTSKNSLLSHLISGAISLILLTLLLVSGPAPTALVFLVLALAGTTVSIVILKQELGEATALGNAFCAGASEKKDCDAVLNSEGATVIGKYKFSDLGLVYFILLSLLSTLVIIHGGNLAIAHYMSLLALPVTLYSIYYQWRVLKKWCLLCLGIVGILWAQAGISVFVTALSIPLSLGDLLLAALILLASLGSWGYLKSKQEALRNTQKTKADYFKFKRNFELFSTLLHENKSLDTHLSATSEIVFGNRQAPTTITIVTNPFCGHCKPVHQLIEDILGQYPDMVKIVVRFNIKLEEKDSDLVRITTRLLEIYEQQGKDLCLMAMSEIYGESTVADWFAKWSECTEPDQYLKTLEAEKAWCHGHKINFTPELFINGLPFPKAYDRSDLIYFIEDLYENDMSAIQADAQTPADIMA